MAGSATSDSATEVVRALDLSLDSFFLSFLLLDCGESVKARADPLLSMRPNSSNSDVFLGVDVVRERENMLGINYQRM